MRCLGCDYRLWNIASRKCPECGLAFRPSAYEFVPNSVQFCCPHCRQSYYGTGPRGQLEPAFFNCVKCGTAISMDEMVLLPAAGVAEESTEPQSAPWLDRRGMSAAGAWWATTKMAITRPGDLIDGVSQSDRPGRDFWYAVLNSLIASVATIAPIMLLPLVLPWTGSAGRLLVVFLLTTVIGSALSVLLYLVGALLWSWVGHLFLRLTGPTRGGGERTRQAVLYSSGANVLTAVPCLGWYFGWIAWVVSATLMVRRSQRVSGLRAGFAMAGPPVLVVVMVMTAYAALIYYGIAKGGFSRGRPVVITAGSFAPLQALRDCAAARGGKPPRHIAELLWGGSLLPSELVASGKDSEAEQIMIGTATIKQMQSMPVEQRAHIIRKFVDGLPEENKPYRVGDYVFAYGGLTFPPPNPKIWVVIEWPLGQPMSVVKIGQADGSIVTMDRSQFPAYLSLQNAVRKTLGMHAIPDLTVQEPDRR